MIEERLIEELENDPLWVNLQKTGIKVKLKDTLTETIRRDWTTAALRRRAGRMAITVGWHSNVSEAIEVQFDDGDKFYLHYKDVEFIPVKQKEIIKKSFFDPSEIVF